MKKSNTKPSKYRIISVIIVLPFISIIWMIGWTMCYIDSFKTIHLRNKKEQLKLQTIKQQANCELDTESQILA